MQPCRRTGVAAMINPLFIERRENGVDGGKGRDGNDKATATTKPLLLLRTANCESRIARNAGSALVTTVAQLPCHCHRQEGRDHDGPGFATTLTNITNAP